MVYGILENHPPPKKIDQWTIIHLPFKETDYKHRGSGRRYLALQVSNKKVPMPNTGHSSGWSASGARWPCCVWMAQWWDDDRMIQRKRGDKSGGLKESPADLLTVGCFLVFLADCFFWPTCQVRVSRFDVSLSFLLFLFLLSSFLSSLPSCQAHSQRHRQLPRQPPLHRHSIASSPALLGPGGPEHYVTMPEKMSDGMSMSEHMPEKMRYNMSHTNVNIWVTVKLVEDHFSIAKVFCRRSARK